MKKSVLSSFLRRGVVKSRTGLIWSRDLNRTRRMRCLSSLKGWVTGWWWCNQSPTETWAADQLKNNHD